MSFYKDWLDGNEEARIFALSRQKQDSVVGAVVEEVNEVRRSYGVIPQLVDSKPVVKQIEFEPVRKRSTLSKHSESSDNHPSIAVLNDRWRVIDVVTNEGLGQWILQYRGSVKLNQWSAPKGRGSFCQTRIALIRDVIRKVTDRDPLAMDILSKLPETHPSTKVKIDSTVLGSARIDGFGVKMTVPTSHPRPDLQQLLKLNDSELIEGCRKSGLFGTYYTETEHGQKKLRRMIRMSGGLSVIEKHCLSMEAI